MSPRRRRFHIALVSLGVFVALIGSAAVLYRFGEPPTRPEPSDRPAPATAAAPDQTTSDPTATAAQDEAGAAASALAFVSAPQSWLYMTDEEIRVAIGLLATQTASGRLADGLVDEISSARTELFQSTGPVWWIVHPLAWTVDRFEPTAATVSVWTFAFLSAADVAVPQTEWTTTSFDLEWVGGRWLVAAFRDTPGPTPAVGASDQPWEPEPLDDALDGFTRLAWGDFG